MELSMKDLKELMGNSSESVKENLNGYFNGEYCIIRTESSGVHCGYVKEHKHNQAIIEGSRRIWSWEGAFTLNKIANDFFKSAKMSTPVDAILLEGIIEILPVKDHIVEKLKNYETHLG